MKLAFPPFALGITMFASPLFAADYPNKTLLVEPADLAKPAVAQSFVILDAREKPKYEAGHIPGSIWVDHAAWAKAFNGGEHANAWSKRIEELGIGASSKIVVLDDNFTKEAARIWWILKFWGVADARLLNGGWKSWTAEKREVTKENSADPRAAKFNASSQANRLATKDYLLKAIEGGKLQIVDARSEKEFCGTEKLSNKKGGAMPGAKQIEWTELLDSTTQRFKPADELKNIFAAAGIDLDKPVATHCQSGGRASVMAFGLELMGGRDVQNYYRSWSEWGNADDTPVVPGKPKEKK